jgi:hypothetical protein
MRSLLAATLVPVSKRANIFSLLISHGTQPISYAWELLARGILSPVR